MRRRPEFRRQAYEASGVLVNAGLGDAVIAFDYKVRSYDDVKGVALEFFSLPAVDILKAVDAGALQIDDKPEILGA